MSIWKQKLLTNWHLMRIVRMAIGVWMLVVGIQTTDWAMGLFGSVFVFMAVTDTGCCGTGQCGTSMTNKSAGKIEETDYEEIK